MNKIPYNKQYIDNKDKKLVDLSLDQELITTGKKVFEFENNIKQFTKSNFAISCNSGTAALHLALMSIDVKKNDIIIMPAINFIASYSMSKSLNAKIYLSDVDPISGIMRPDLLESCIKKNKIKKIKAIITMHHSGSPKYILEYYKLKKKYNFFIIEDACHAFGSKYKINNKIFITGCCKHSDISTFSFHPVKSITTGEGGALTTNSKIIYKKASLLRSHGIERNISKSHWTYDIKKMGFNYRLSDINCALGIAQLKKINFFVRKRREIANFYLTKLKKLDNIVKLPEVTSNITSSWHLFLISINFKKIKSNKTKLFNFLKSKKIFAQFHYIPVYRFNITKKKYKKLENSEYYFNNSLSIPIYPSLSKKDQRRVIVSIFQFLKKRL